MNEKIYILLWFWFVFLSTVSAMQLVWRVFSIMSGRMREFILRGQSRLLAGPEDISVCCSNISLGDWLILISTLTSYNSLPKVSRKHMIRRRRLSQMYDSKIRQINEWNFKL